MNTRHYAILWAACLAIAGCRTDPNIALLERELRLQEDRIYQSQECIEEHQQSLESCRRENAALRKRLEAPGGEPEFPAELPRPEVKVPGLTEPQPPQVKVPGLTEPKPQPLEAPQSPRTLPVPSGQGVPRPIPPGAKESKHDPSASAIGPAAPVLKVDNAQVKKIALNRLLTGGYDADGRPGDEGITMLIEAYDAQGRLVESAAPVSVVVLDPALQGQGDAARVARWDFSAAEIAAMFRKTPLAQGIYLEMLWPANPPARELLYVVVRFTTSDGRKLEAERQIQVKLASGQSQQWVPLQPTAPTSRAAGPEAASQPALPTEDQQPETLPDAREPSLAPPGSPTRPAARPPRPDARVQRPVWSPYR